MSFDYENPGEQILNFEEKVKNENDGEIDTREYFDMICFLAMSNKSPSEAAERIEKYAE